MFDKKRLLTISGLNLGGIIESMSNNELDSYLLMLNSFIDMYPALEEKIKDALIEKKYDVFSQKLEELVEILKKIHANSFADDCFWLEDIKHEKLETYTAYFLAGVSMLAIDIQMAAYKAVREEAVYEKRLKNGKVNVYAVDDAKFFLTRLKGLLKDTDYEITLESSPLNAVEYLKDFKPDLFILDIEMPELNGYELAKKIQELGHKAPIIFLTGNFEKEHIKRAVDSGASDFILKPINKELLLERISKYIVPVKAGTF